MLRVFSAARHLFGFVPCSGPLCRESAPLFSASRPFCVQRMFLYRPPRLFGPRVFMCTAHVFVQGPCTVAWASAPLCVGFPRCGRAVCGRVVCGGGGCCFPFGLGALCGAASLFFRVLRRCWFRAMCFRLRAGVAVRPCAFRWLAPGHRTMLRLERKKREKTCILHST